MKVSYTAILVIALWGLFFISFLEMTNWFRLKEKLYWKKKGLIWLRTIQYYNWLVISALDT